MDGCELPMPVRRREEIGRTPMLGVAFDAATLLVDFRPGVPAHPRVATAAAVDGPQALLPQLRAHFGAGEIAQFTFLRWHEGREAFVAQGLLAVIADRLRALGVEDAEQRMDDAWGRIPGEET